MARPKTVRRLRGRVASLESELAYVTSQLVSREEELGQLKSYYPDKIAELENTIRVLLAQRSADSAEPITQLQAVEMLVSARSEAEWASVVGEVKNAFGGTLPSYWDLAEKGALLITQKQDMLACESARGRTN